MSSWQWYLSEVFAKINGDLHYLWRAVDHERDLFESSVTKTRDRKVALKFLKNLKCDGKVETLVTDRLRSYGAAMKVIAYAERQKTGHWLGDCVKIYLSHSGGGKRPCV